MHYPVSRNIRHSMMSQYETETRKFFIGRGNDLNSADHSYVTFRAEFQKDEPSVW